MLVISKAGVFASKILTSSISTVTSTTTALQGQVPENLGPEIAHELSMTLALTPRVRSCAYSTMAMALNFGGYEFARNSALALFTSTETGFSHPSAFPFAMAMVTPISLGFLFWYGILINRRGPRQALRATSLVSALILIGCSLLIQATNGTYPLISKCMVYFLFVFANSYTHLINTQQWSFLGSVMSSAEGAKWFSVMAGITSIVCTSSAMLIPTILPMFGLLGLMGLNGMALLTSLALSERAYHLAEKFDFEPSAKMLEKMSKKNTAAAQTSSPRSDATFLSIFERMATIFNRVPTLAALFGEVVSFQSLCTIMNTLFVLLLRESGMSDLDRAAYTGRFYGYVNGVAGLLQFIVLPLTLRQAKLQTVIMLVPSMMIPILGYSALQTPTLSVVTTAFFLLKTMDYTVRTVVNEMVCQGLDYESRYLGKEVVGVLANRIGKSGLSTVLSVVAPMGFGVAWLNQFSVVVGGLWSYANYKLSCQAQNAEQTREANQGSKIL